MAGDFKLIQVNAEEDDVVIHAGVPAEPECTAEISQIADEVAESASAVDIAADEVAESAQIATATAAPGAMTEFEQVRDGGEAVESAQARGADAKPSIAQEAAKAAPKAAPRQRKDQYRETTLEDLQSDKMSTTQKVVIIAAVICIIGALTYYFMFMR